MARGQRTGRPYRRHRDKVIADGDACVICGLAVDKSLPGRHSWGPSLHHVEPLRWGGGLLDPGNGGLAHTGCNAAVRDAQSGTSRYVRAVLNRRSKAMRATAKRIQPTNSSLPSPSCDW